MKDPRQKAEQLIHVYLSGEATEAQRNQLERLYMDAALKKEFVESPDHDENEIDRIGRESWMRIIVEIQSTKPKPRVYWPLLAAAAVLFLVVAAGLFYYKSHSDVNLTIVANVKPGGNQAILILADGRKITLKDVKTGQVVLQPGISITKAAGGQLVYRIIDQKGSDSLTFNTLQTPMGGQYQVNLPDGTKVWLNAATSLRFPASFANQRQRTVELNGEAYFEVAKNVEMPFSVISKGQIVKVTGTHFNISSYSDDPFVKTTLLEGAVNVNGQMLKPGQQAQLRPQGLQIIAADTEQEVAWKNGEFIFNGEDLQSIMRKIARWYNVEIVYEVKPRTFHFDGELSRSADLSTVLNTLELTGDVKFKVTGRRVTLIK